MNDKQGKRASFLRKLWQDGGDPLEQWTNAQLDSQYPPESLDGVLRFLSRLNERKDLPSQIRCYAAELRSGVVKLQDKGDRLEAAAALLPAVVAILDPAEGLKESPKRGRPKGSSPRLAEADADVTRISALWKSVFKINATSRQAPSAIEIAARRHGVEPVQLENFRKNRSKLRAGK